MPKLNFYKQFGGNAPHTSCIQKSLVHQGLTLEDGQPVDEAFLYGLSGGAALGYFQFAYSNVDPQINILTRNTFNNYGWDTVTSRMGLSQDLIHSTSEKKAERKLIETLEQGLVPIIWADTFTLGYEHSEMGQGMWSMQPLIILDYEPSADTARISDRSDVALSLSAKLLLEAWGKIKKDRYKLITLQQVHAPDYPMVINQALADCRSLYLEKPPRGSANNFGFKAFDAIIKDLRGGHAKSWKKLLASPRYLAAGLLSAFKYALHYWKDDSESADRMLFAGFLRRSGEILGEGAYAQAADAFFEAGKSWQKLADLFLPDDQPVLAELKTAFRQRQKLFREQGMSALKEIQSLDKKMGELLAEAKIAPEEAGDLFEAIADQFEGIRDLEKRALGLLPDA
jgi:hypothetical protein